MKGQASLLVEADQMKELCDQILPQARLDRMWLVGSQKLERLQIAMEALASLTVAAQAAVLNPVSTPEEPSPVNSASSADSVGSASTQRYETSWGELIIFNAMVDFIEVRDMLRRYVYVNDAHERFWYNVNMEYDAQLEAKKADWYRRTTGRIWRVIGDTPSYAQFRKAESEKNKRIASAKEFLQTMDTTFDTQAKNLLIVKRNLLQIIDAIPVPLSDLTEEMRAQIHNFRYAIIPLVVNELPQQPEPSWIDRIGYEMRRALKCKQSVHLP